MSRKVRLSWRVELETGGVFGPEGATSEELEPENRFCQSPIVIVSLLEKVQHRTRRKGVRAMSGRPMRVQARTARESRRHDRGIRRRPAGGE